MKTDVSVREPSTNGALIDRVQQLRLDNQLGRGPMTGGGRGSWLPWVLCGLLAFAWVGLGVRYLKSRPSDAGGNAAAGGAAQTQSAVGQQVAPGELVLQIKGTVIPFLQINLSPDDVSGVVEKIDFKEGDRVPAKKVLAWIRRDRYLNDNNSAKATVLSAEAQVDKARTAVASATARVAKAEATLVRTTLDLERAKNNTVTSQATIDEAEANRKIALAERQVAATDVETSQASLAAARAEADVSRSRLNETARLLANCEVRAPMNGTILTKVADKGVLVSPMSFNVAAGICSMADLSQLEVEIDVPERQILKIKQGLDCIVQADADPTRQYRGVVDRVMPIADDTKNVVKVRVRVYLRKGESAGEFLKPKMSVVATVYNRPFKFNPETDQGWEDEKK